MHKPRAKLKCGNGEAVHLSWVLLTAVCQANYLISSCCTLHVRCQVCKSQMFLVLHCVLAYRVMLNMEGVEGTLK